MNPSDRARASVTRALGYSALLTLALAGCAGSTDSQTGATATVTPVPVPSNVAYHRRHGHRHRRHHGGGGGAATALGAGALGAGAVAAGGAAPAAPQAPSSGGAWACDDAQFGRDQAAFAAGSLRGDREVDVCGTVSRVLAERTTRSGLHGYYDLMLPSGATIEIVSDLGEMDAPAWPWVKTGDYSYVQGRYYYDSSGSQGIDWTHHGTSNSWPSAGYVVVNGTEYR